MLELVQDQSLFEMLFKEDQKMQERALITFAAISLNTDSPCLEKFYELKLI